MPRLFRANSNALSIDSGFGKFGQQVDSLSSLVWQGILSCWEGGCHQVMPLPWEDWVVFNILWVGASSKYFIHLNARAEGLKAQHCIAKKKKKKTNKKKNSFIHFTCQCFSVLAGQSKVYVPHTKALSCCLACMSPRTHWLTEFNSDVSDCRCD